MCKHTLDHAQELCTYVGLQWITHVELRDTLSFDPEFWLDAAKRRGVEGWVFKVSNYHGWWKLKVVKTVDLVVTGLKDGRGKYLGLVGALKCSTWRWGSNLKLVEVAAVSGMTDEQRVDIDSGHVGRVCEVAYQLVGSRGRLRHPRFVRWRPDKRAEDCTLSQDMETIGWLDVSRGTLGCRTPAPKCECGVVVGLYFSERLDRYVCPKCLDDEVAGLTERCRELECDDEVDRLERLGGM